jgi:hypothetical protein
MRKPGSYLQNLKKTEDQEIFDYGHKVPQESRLRQEFDEFNKKYLKAGNLETSPSASDAKCKIAGLIRFNS